jgi:hypothetical protein
MNTHRWLNLIAGTQYVNLLGQDFHTIPGHCLQLCAWCIFPCFCCEKTIEGINRLDRYRPCRLVKWG